MQEYRQYLANSASKPSSNTPAQPTESAENHSAVIDAQAQIPKAENEADRLFNDVNFGSPESVKSVMGQKLEADFSNDKLQNQNDFFGDKSWEGYAAYLKKKNKEKQAHSTE